MMLATVKFDCSCGTVQAFVPVHEVHLRREAAVVWASRVKQQSPQRRHAARAWDLPLTNPSSPTEKGVVSKGV